MTLDPAISRTDPVDPPVLRRNRGQQVFWGTLAGLLAFGVPVWTTIAVGPEPYERLSRGFPGLDVALTTTVLRVVADSASILSVGVIVVLLFLRDAPPRRAKYLPDGFEVRVLQWASGAWALSALGLIVLTALDQNGVPFNGLLEKPSAFTYFYQLSDYPKAWTVAFVVASSTWIVSWFATRWTTMLAPLWASFFGLLAPVVVGQVLVGPDHDFAGDAAVFHTLAGTVFFGAVAALCVRAASGRFATPLSLRRVFLLGAVALPMITVTDIIIGVIKLADTALTDSHTGWQILSRWAILGCLWLLAGYSIGTWRAGRLTEQRILQLLVASALAIAAWIGVGVAMTRIPPPHYFVPTSISQVFMGFEVPDPPSVLVLVTAWRPNFLFLGLALGAVVIYLFAVRVLRRRGDAWPVGRTIAWMLGWSVVVIATSSGFGRYSAPDFGVHMIVHMSLNMLAPGLLVLGGMMTLLLRASQSRQSPVAGLHDWLMWIMHWKVLRFVYNPLLIFVLFVGSYYGLYFSGIFGEFMRFHWAHQLMNLHFLIVGYLYYSLIIGVDRAPRQLPHIGKLGYVLAAMPFHAFFGVILMTSAGNGEIIAENFYRYLGLPWADLAASQYVAGGVAWAGGELPLMVVIVVLGIQWSRQDAREARRKDRHLDTGRDDEFDAYNRMLNQLESRRTPGPQHPGPMSKESQP